MNETLDAISGLGVVLRQMRAGHRIGLDAVLLAAAAGEPADVVADVGAGVGGVGLALARRFPAARVDLIEIDAATASLAQDNAARNGLADRTRVIVCDVTRAATRRAAGLIDAEADLVVTNPPFHDPAAARVSPDPARARAHALTGADPLASWLRASLALLAPGGRFAMIHRPDVLPQLYAAIGRRLGAISVRPVHPRRGEDAIRVLVAGVKGSRAPTRLRPPLILHEADGRATEEARALHEGRATLPG